MRIFKITLLIGFLFVSLLSRAQDQILEDSETAEAEFHTAINPTDNNNIVVATMRGFDDVKNSYFTIYYTKDFGETWEVSEFQGKYDGYLGTGDPVLAFNNEGKLSLAHLVVDENDDVLTILSSSADFGETWVLEYIYDQYQFTDKPWLTIDKSNISPHESNVYLTTVGDLVELICLDKNYSITSLQSLPVGNQLPSIVTNKTGDIFVSAMKWTDPLEMIVAKYTDGGETFVHSSIITSLPDYTFNSDLISTRFQPSPYLAVDNSDGIYSGRLYYSYTGSEEINPDFFNVFITYSDDDGVTWSEPKIVHSDINDSVHQFYSSIYVNNKGVLVLDWYDRTNHLDLNTDFFMGISYDGGENFTELQLNSEPMDFLVASQAGFGFGIGDYHQLVATDNTAISFWSDGRTNDGDLNIYFAKVDIDSPPVGIHEQTLISDKISVSSIYSQPVQDEINFSVKLDKALNLKFDIISLDGNIVQEGDWIPYTSGKFEVNTPIQLPSGQYILQVSADNGYFKNQKFVVVK